LINTSWQSNLPIRSRFIFEEEELNEQVLRDTIFSMRHSEIWWCSVFNSSRANYDKELQKQEREQIHKTELIVLVVEEEEEYLQVL